MPEIFLRSSMYLIRLKYVLFLFGVWICYFNSLQSHRIYKYSINTNSFSRKLWWLSIFKLTIILFIHSFIYLFNFMCQVLYVSVILGGDPILFQEDRHFNSIICKQTKRSSFHSEQRYCLTMHTYTHIFILCSLLFFYFTHYHILSQYYILEYFYFKRIVDSRSIPKKYILGLH